MRSEVDLVPSEYAIHLKKVIPLGSGLGGGSSNAATTLNALNELWKLNLSQKYLENIGTKLGADIPFFIKGGLQLAEGTGEKLTPQNDHALRELIFLLIAPPIHISTSEAYCALNKPLLPVENNSKFASLSKPVNWQLFDNDFEKVIRKTYPEIGDIIDNLHNTEALYAGLSGSGSTVFGVFNNLQSANSARDDFLHYQTFLTFPVFHS
jgi:4-diphosphocytidyl-2-C-methyl-D-erythritol kinase